MSILMNYKLDGRKRKGKKRIFARGGGGEGVPTKWHPIEAEKKKRKGDHCGRRKGGGGVLPLK